jgi:hypothetical protein
MNSEASLVSYISSTIAVTGAISIGQGYDARLNRAKNRVIAIDLESQKDSPGIKTEYVFEYVENYSELATALNVSASMGYGATGASGGSASVNIFRATRMERASAYVVFRMRIFVKQSTLIMPSMEPVALNLTQTGNYQALLEKFGSMFVRSLYYGGDLACILEFSSNNASDSSSFRADIKAQVGLAKAAGAVDQSIITLTSGRSVRIKYSQNGGSTGKSNNGIFTATPAELQARLIEFPNEVLGASTGLDTSVPLVADLSSIRETLNWPSTDRTDLDRPYPPAIQSIADTLLQLTQKQVDVEGVLAASGVFAPSVRESASALRPYLNYIIGITRSELTRFMANAIDSPELKIENFTQYRVRGMLGVKSEASRSNSGGSCDLSEKDKGMLFDSIFGSMDFPTVKPWPELTFEGKWGFKGEHVEGYEGFGGLNTGTYMSCEDDVNAVAASLAGKASAGITNDGIFVWPTMHPHTVGGHRCGYSAWHFSIVKMAIPDQSLLPALPAMPSIVTPSTVVSTGTPLVGDNGRWLLPFTISTPQVYNCGKYTIEVQIKNTQNGDITEVLDDSYWISNSGGQVELKHPVDLEPGLAIASFAVQI